MKIFLNIIILILLSFTNAQSASIGAHINVDEANKTVVFLRQQSQKTIMMYGKSVELFYRDPDTNEYKPIKEETDGSGFIIKYNGHDYLVTAKHVAEVLSPTGEIVINVPGDKSTIITFQSISSALKGAHWFHHPQADISIHPMVYPVMVDAGGIPPEFFPKKDIDVELLSPAVIVGFPLGLGVLDKLSPVAKEAKIASKLTSITNYEIPKELHFYFLDQALSQGYSGSPVFWIGADNKVSILGVLKGALSDQTGGKISLVVPISYIWDILESKDFQSYEKGIKK